MYSGASRGHGKDCECSEGIRRRRESGLTVAEFCEWNGVALASFYNWQKKLQGTKSRRESLELITPAGRSPQKRPAGSFLPVHVMQAGANAAPATRIEIRLTGGVRTLVPISDFETIENTLAAPNCLAALNDFAMNQH